MSVAVEWSEDGNPIAWCPWCRVTHEWTVKRSESEWACWFVDGMESAIMADLATRTMTTSEANRDE